MNEPTFLASLMPSELTGLFNKLALEYCSPPSPFAIAELLLSRCWSDTGKKNVDKYQTRPIVPSWTTICLKTEMMRWHRRVDVVIFRAPRPFQTCHSPHVSPRPSKGGPHRRCESSHAYTAVSSSCSHHRGDKTSDAHSGHFTEHFEFEYWAFFKLSLGSWKNRKKRLSFHLWECNTFQIYKQTHSPLLQYPCVMSGLELYHWSSEVMPL